MRHGNVCCLTGKGTGSFGKPNDLVESRLANLLLIGMGNARG